MPNKIEAPITEQLDDESVSENEAFTAAVITRMLTKSAKFNLEVLSLPIPATPLVITGDRLEWSNDAFQEELGEYNVAAEEDDVLEQADALIDLIYFALGRLVEMGVPAMAVFDGVQTANMGKERGELAKRRGSKGFDAVKPAGWVAPDHSWLLNFRLSDIAELEHLREAAKTREALSPVWLELQKLREEKGQDYNNIPGGREAYFPYGHQSYAHMVHTKTLRIQSILNSMGSGRKLNFESLYDSVADLVNYGTYYAEAIRNGLLSGETE